MEKIDFERIGQSFARALAVIDFDRLPISDYNKQYIGRLKPALPYYLAIYADCLRKGLEGREDDLKNITLVDYGGGSGFLSLYAKRLGIGQVIYIDLNPKSVETINVLTGLLGQGPDRILEGDSDRLAACCREQGIRPDLLVATDLIEHVYSLEAFFRDLLSIHDGMRMLFTTASTPFNPYVVRRLHRMMAGCERGTLESPNYYTLRRQFIRENFPAIEGEELARWAEATRGMTFEDMRRALTAGHLPVPADPFNTCDPRTGNWTERILPLDAYRDLLSPYHYEVRLSKGFYNTMRSKALLNGISLAFNFLIRHGGNWGYRLAPFILLDCRRKA